MDRAPSQAHPLTKPKRPLMHPERTGWIMMKTARQQVQGESAKHKKGLNIRAENGVEATVESVQREANKATQKLQATVEKERGYREQNERNIAIAKVRDVSTWHKSNVVH